MTTDDTRKLNLLIEPKELREKGLNWWGLSCFVSSLDKHAGHSSKLFVAFRHRRSYAQIWIWLGLSGIQSGAAEPMPGPEGKKPTEVSSQMLLDLGLNVFGLHLFLESTHELKPGAGPGWWKAEVTYERESDAGKIRFEIKIRENDENDKNGNG